MPRCSLGSREFAFAFRDGADCPACGLEHERMGLLTIHNPDFEEKEEEPWATLNAAPDPEAAYREWQRSQEDQT